MLAHFEKYCLKYVVPRRWIKKPGGRAMNRFKVVFFFILFSMFALSVHAYAVQEHPLIRPFPGSVIAPKSVYQNFAEKFGLATPSKVRILRSASSQAEQCQITSKVQRLR
jgi:hypothetical protein